MTRIVAFYYILHIFKRKAAIMNYIQLRNYGVHRNLNSSPITGASMRTNLWTSSIEKSQEHVGRYSD
jgi:hypothetical protein